MGTTHSQPLAEITKEQVANHVTSLGPEYQEYAVVIDDNGIDGDFLSEMDDDIFTETLDDAEITNPDHRQRLLEEYQAYAAAAAAAAADLPTTGIQTADMNNSSKSLQYNSAQLAAFNTDHPNRATEAEQSHLGNNFYNKIDSNPDATRPPIAKDDADRVAQVESYKLEEIEPDSEIAQKLGGLVQMAMNLFDVDLGDITFLNNECQYSLARVGLTKPMEQAIMDKVYTVLNYSSDGKPFVCKTDRSIGICNYPTYSRRSFVVPDIEEDIAFQWMRVVWPFRSYMGAPLLSATGVVIGTLCMHSLAPRTDLDRGCEIQLEQVANMVVQSIENWKLRRNISRLETTRLALQTTKNKDDPPKEKAVVVFCGIEDYESLAAIATNVLQTGMVIYHDVVERSREKYFGYQVAKDNNGGYFLVFHDAVDAFGFALDLQQHLFDAEWSEELLALPRVGDNGCGFRGLRAKLGAYMGAVTALKNHKTGRTEYESVKSGAIGIAKNLYAMAYGGQILTVFDTWNVASFLAETKLYSPQVVDLGLHVIRKGKNTDDGVIKERVVQLVPAPLAIDFSETAKMGDSMGSMDDVSCGELSRSSADIGSAGMSTSSREIGSADLGPEGTWGRQFPDINSVKKLSLSFYDAPAFNATSDQAFVTIAFIGTSEIEKRFKEAASIVSKIIGLASEALIGTAGYQCQNNMLAFPNIREAVSFGLTFRELLRKQKPLEGGVNPSELVTYGCVHDSFISLEPHKTTGRADYFGKVVNRAARVAYTSALGSVCFGENVTPDFDKDAFDLGDPKISLKFVDCKKLKGVEGTVAVFECHRSYENRAAAAKLYM